MAKIKLNLPITKRREFSWKARELEFREVRLFVHKLFAHRRVKAILGTNLAFALIVTSFAPTHELVKAEAEESVIPEANAVLKTEKALQYPTDPIVITQGFRFYHPGIDLDGVTGDPIRPIKKGRVKEIGHSKFNYGNSIIIEHEGELTSLYAHLSEIDVEPGEEVTTDTVIGKMGATGHAFGDHLHLEIHDHGRAVNPTSVLPR